MPDLAFIYHILLSYDIHAEMGLDQIDLIHLPLPSVTLAQFISPDLSVFCILRSAILKQHDKYTC